MDGMCPAMELQMGQQYWNTTASDLHSYLHGPDQLVILLTGTVR